MSAYSPQHSTRSLIYIKNKSGPKTLPCGIPLVTSHHFEELRLTLKQQQQKGTRQSTNIRQGSLLSSLVCNFFTSAPIPQRLCAVREPGWRSYRTVSKQFDDVYKRFGHNSSILRMVRQNCYSNIAPCLSSSRIPSCPLIQWDISGASHRSATNDFYQCSIVTLAISRKFS